MQRRKPRGITGRRKPRQDANHLPHHIGTGFEAELDKLLSHLSATALSADASHDFMRRQTLSAYEFKVAYLLSEYKSKYLDGRITSPADRRLAAIEKWHKTEEANVKTNIRLMNFETDFGYASSSDIKRRASALIAEILGDYPTWFASKDVHSSGMTNGASTRVPRSPCAALEKLTGIAHSSETAVPYWYVVTQDTTLSDLGLAIKNESVLFTVPKSTDIDRVACKEPEVNMYLQRAVGDHIRSRLKRLARIDLNDQSVNQRLAALGSRDGSLATLDLSAASDSVTKQLVYSLLPLDWAWYLDQIRVKATMIDDTPVELEMFSSMGNGFTFELESLIFWALLQAISLCSHDMGYGRRLSTKVLSVYGDDLIVPRDLATRVMRVFAWFGFRVNAKKSHYRKSSRFRESCGKHYFRGFDVTPFYIRGPVRTRTDIIRLLNRLYVWDANGLQFITDPDILAFHRSAAERYVPQSLWGGQDPDMDSSLVTGDAPRSYLKAVSKPLGYDADGRFRNRRMSEDEFNVASLRYWLTAKARLEESLVEVAPTTQTRYKIARQSKWAVRLTHRPWLLEQGNCVSS